MEIAYSKDFQKSFAKLSKKTQAQFATRLSIYFHDPQHPILNTHGLSGALKDYQSFNVTGDIRALFTIRNNGQIVYLDMIGTYAQLYT